MKSYFNKLEKDINDHGYGKFMIIILQVVSNMHDYMVSKFDIRILLPEKLHTFLVQVKKCYTGNTRIEKDHRDMVAELAIYAKDYLFILYLKFFEKIIDVKEKMPYHPPMRVIDANLALLLKLRTQLLSRIYTDANSGENYFSTIFCSFVQLPHVKNCFSNNEKTNKNRIGLQNRKLQQQKFEEAGCVPEFISDYVNGDPSGLLAYYFNTFESHFMS